MGDKSVGRRKRLNDEAVPDDTAQKTDVSRCAVLQEYKALECKLKDDSWEVDDVVVRMGVGPSAPGLAC
jgi:hypothetical protein